MTPDDLMAATLERIRLELEKAGVANATGVCMVIEQVIHLVVQRAVTEAMYGAADAADAHPNKNIRHSAGWWLRQQAEALRTRGPR